MCEEPDVTQELASFKEDVGRSSIARSDFFTNTGICIVQLNNKIELTHVCLAYRNVPFEHLF